MSERPAHRAAAEIAADLERLEREARAAGLALLAYLIELAKDAGRRTEDRSRRDGEAQDGAVHS